MVYNYDIEYQRSEGHTKAEALSGFPRAHKDDPALEQEIYHLCGWGACVS